MYCWLCTIACEPVESFSILGDEVHASESLVASLAKFSILKRIREKEWRKRCRVSIISTIKVVNFR